MEQNNKKLIIAFAAIAISQIIFFCLKVTEIIHWKWIWVFAPIWLPYISLIVCGLMLIAYMSIKNMKKRE